MRRRYSLRERERERDSRQTRRSMERAWKGREKILEKHKRRKERNQTAIKILEFNVWMDTLAATLGRIYMDIRRRNFFFFGPIQKRYTLSTWKKKEGKKVQARQSEKARQPAMMAMQWLTHSLFECDKRTDRTLFSQRSYIWPWSRSDPTLSYAFLTFPTLSPRSKS